jgi:hypothetical protein
VTDGSYEKEVRLSLSRHHPYLIAHA